jgi:hypothetical protein
MPDLPISSLPLSSSGSPDSLMVIVNSGVTESIYFSALTNQFVAYTIEEISTGTTLTWSYNYYGLQNSTNITLILPTTSGKDGYYITIKDEVGTCATNNVTILPDSVGELIDNESSIVMSINKMSLTFMVRNGAWFLI